MKTTILLLVLALTACGGNAFTYGSYAEGLIEAGDDSAPGPDGAPDAEPGREGGQDAGVDVGSDGQPTTEAGDGGKGEAGKDAGVVDDGGTTCTPFSTSVVTDGGCANLIAAPSFFQLVTPDASLCTNQNTPAHCQCKETYDCTCVAAFDMQGACVGGGTWVSCKMVDSIVSVTCSAL